MGMFDDVLVDSDVFEQFGFDLPLEGWQTKSLDCLMDCYKISKELTLLIQRYEIVDVPKDERPYPDRDDLFGLVGATKAVNHAWCEYDTGFNGSVRFYQMIKKEWFEFVASFKDGKIISLEREENKI